MSVVTFILIVFGLASMGVFVANKVHAKRIGARDVPFLLEAYREIDAMELNGPPMAPPRQIEEIKADLDRIHASLLADMQNDTRPPVGIENAPQPTSPLLLGACQSAREEGLGPGCRPLEAFPSYPRREQRHGRLNQQTMVYADGTDQLTILAKGQE